MSHWCFPLRRPSIRSITYLCEWERETSTLFSKPSSSVIQKIRWWYLLRESMRLKSSSDTYFEMDSQHHTSTVIWISEIVCVHSKSTKKEGYVSLSGQTSPVEDSIWTISTSSSTITYHTIQRAISTVSEEREELELMEKRSCSSLLKRWDNSNVSSVCTRSRSVK